MEQAGEISISRLSSKWELDLFTESENRSFASSRRFSSSEQLFEKFVFLLCHFLHGWGSTGENKAHDFWLSFDFSGDRRDNTTVEENDDVGVLPAKDYKKYNYYSGYILYGIEKKMQLIK